jgi:hypothetical protein
VSEVLVSALLAKIEQAEKLAERESDGFGKDGSLHDVGCGYRQREWSLPCDCDAPERVLRLCRAHRDIIERHAEISVAPGRRETTCVECGSVSGWPCPTLRDLARGLGVEETTDGQ